MSSPSAWRLFLVFSDTLHLSLLTRPLLPSRLPPLLLLLHFPWPSQSPWPSSQACPSSSWASPRLPPSPSSLPPSSCSPSGRSAFASPSPGTQPPSHHTSADS